MAQKCIARKLEQARQQHGVPAEPRVDAENVKSYYSYAYAFRPFQQVYPSISG
jgi:hypothetical protein